MSYHRHEEINYLSWETIVAQASSLSDPVYALGTQYKIPLFLAFSWREECRRLLGDALNQQINHVVRTAKNPPQPIMVTRYPSALEDKNEFRTGLKSIPPTSNQDAMFEMVSSMKESFFPSVEFDAFAIWGFHQKQSTLQDKRNWLLSSFPKEQFDEVPGQWLYNYAKNHSETWLDFLIIHGHSIWLTHWVSQDVLSIEEFHKALDKIKNQPVGLSGWFSTAKENVKTLELNIQQHALSSIDESAFKEQQQPLSPLQKDHLAEKVESVLALYKAWLNRCETTYKKEGWKTDLTLDHLKYILQEKIETDADTRNHLLDVWAFRRQMVSNIKNIDVYYKDSPQKIKKMTGDTTFGLSYDLRSSSFLSLLLNKSDQKQNIKLDRDWRFIFQQEKNEIEHLYHKLTIQGKDLWPDKDTFAPATLSEMKTVNGRSIFTTTQEMISPKFNIIRSVQEQRALEFLLPLVSPKEIYPLFKQSFLNDYSVSSSGAKKINNASASDVDQHYLLLLEHLQHLDSWCADGLITDVSAIKVLSYLRYMQTSKFKNGHKQLVQSIAESLPYHKYSVETLSSFIQIVSDVLFDDLMVQRLEQDKPGRHLFNTVLSKSLHAWAHQLVSQGIKPKEKDIDCLLQLPFHLMVKEVSQSPDLVTVLLHHWADKKNINPVGSKITDASNFLNTSQSIQELGGKIEQIIEDAKLSALALRSPQMLNDFSIYEEYAHFFKRLSLISIDEKNIDKMPNSVFRKWETPIKRQQLMQELSNVQNFVFNMFKKLAVQKNREHVSAEEHAWNIQLFWMTGLSRSFKEIKEMLSILENFEKLKESNEKLDIFGPLLDPEAVIEVWSRHKSHHQSEVYQKLERFVLSACVKEEAAIKNSTTKRKM